VVEGVQAFLVPRAIRNGNEAFCIRKNHESEHGRSLSAEISSISNKGTFCGSTKRAVKGSRLALGINAAISDILRSSRAEFSADGKATNYRSRRDRHDET
jgi:hypothetical protein